jgi:hypothetical protein
MPDSIHQLRKPKVCPKCGAEKVRRIYYGRPLPKTMAKVKRGIAVLGGCFLQLWSPDWECAMCHHRWFDRDDPAKQKMEEELQQIVKRK